MYLFWILVGMMEPQRDKGQMPRKIVGPRRVMVTIWRQISCSRIIISLEKG